LERPRLWSGPGERGAQGERFATRRFLHHERFHRNLRDGESAAERARDGKRNGSRPGGNLSDPSTVSFTVDTIPPTILVTQPTNGVLTSHPDQTFAGTLSELGTLTLNGAAATVSPDNSFTASVTLQEGTHSVILVAKDRAGNTAQVSVSVTLDTVSPTAIDSGRITVTSSGGGTVAVSAPAGSAEANASATLVNARTGVTVTTTTGADGSFAASLAGQAGDVLTIVLTDAAGNRSAATSVTIPGSSQEGLPPDPSTVATPLDRTVATDIASATAFLYSGEHPIQGGVAPGVIDPKRVAVLRGRSLDRNGSPVPGVQISILDHPELGTTLSRADGAFDLAVNGGGVLTVGFEKAGFLTIQRQVEAPWRDFIVMADTVLVPFDQAVTAITSGSSSLQVARGSSSSDADGSRRATLLFPPGITAQIVNPDESRVPLSSFHVRATEYTVGSNGPRAMPGPLPANVGYTWAAELSVDEAAAAGAERVEFSAPVSLYVENFLGFPVGGPVPAGFYDRRVAAWMGSDNGRIISILGTDGDGRALIDIDGSGLPADAVALATLSITADEQQALAGLYAAGQSLWRVPISHFSPWDCNWPYGPPDDAEQPPDDDMAQDEGQTDDDNDCASGSIIECQSQVLGEQIGVIGTPFSVTYRSDEVPGRTASYTAKIQVTGATIPGSLKRVDLEIDIAGQRVLQSFPPQPNLTYTFTWDGRDAYGRLLQGAAPLTFTKAYVYDFVYLNPSTLAEAWGRFPDSAYEPIGGGRDGGEFQLVRQRTHWVEEVARTVLGGWDARALGLGGWRLDVHHSYDPVSRTLYLGTGARRSAASLPPLLYRAVGTGEAGDSGDGGRAELAQISSAGGLAFGSDGSLYIADPFSHRVRRVNPAGIITTLAGDGTRCAPDVSNGGAADCGDGIPAINAHLREPSGVAVGADGSVWIADTGDNCVRRVDPAGVITTVAGACDGGGTGVGQLTDHPGSTKRTNLVTADCEDCPGTSMALKSPIDLVLAPDGGLYISDSENDRILYLNRSGRIRTIAGGGHPSDGIGDGGAARDADLLRPLGIALGRDGSLYIAQPYYNLVRRVAPNGVITTAAGNVNATGDYCGDGGPATSACLSFPTKVTATPDGGFLVVDTNNQLIRRVAPDGIISTAMGAQQGAPSLSVNGSASLGIALDNVAAVAVAPDGSVDLSSSASVFRQSPALSGFTEGNLILPDPTGTQVYIFDSAGRHLQTIDPLTHATLYTFGYDANGLLTSIRDVDGKQTLVERSTAGAPTALIGPFGQRTELGLDGDNYLSQVKNPAGEQMSFTYGPGGLLESSQDPRGGQSHYEFFGFGSLNRAKDRAGAEKTLVRTNGNNGLYFVDLTSGMGRLTHYQTQLFEDGSRFNARRDPSGEITTTLRGLDGGQGTGFPDGSSASLTPAPDPRWGLLSPAGGSLKLLTPGGLSRQVSSQRAVVLSNPDDPLALASIVDTLTINGRDFLSTYDAANRRFTLRTPEGRERTLSVNEKGRPATIQLANLEPVDLEYDDLGRLSSVARGTGDDRRAFTLEYDDKGWLSKINGPLSQNVQFEHDDAGRILRQISAAGTAISFSYDPNGNLNSVTPSGKPIHQFDFTAVDLLSTYNPPPLGTGTVGTTYSYNLDQQLTQVNRPDGRSIDLGYDARGRSATVASSEGLSRLSYDPITGRLASLSSPDGETIGYTYDGFLPTGTAWSGQVAGTVTRTYDDSFHLVSTSVNGADPITFQYDRDDLPVQAGNLTLQRNSANGFLAGTTLGEVATTQSYNGFGELGDFQASFGSTPLYEASYTRDKLGRITEKVETLGNITEILDYDYDSAGRLADIIQNGTVIAHYDYDENGNRLSESTPAGTVACTYDTQDRLLQHGDVTYTYSANGELATKTQNGAVVTYTYDDLGSLRQVGLPSGITIDYITDGKNRRVGKMVNGTLVQGFLYKDLLSPIATLDGEGRVTARFVYASQTHVPDYLVKGGVTYRMVSDHLGSPRLIVASETGEVVQQMDYDAFGRVTLDTNPGFQPFGFAGGLYDYQTGLVHFGARDYDPEVGRWTTKDPIRFSGGSANIYQYCYSDPINWIDPDGLNNRKPGKTPPSSWPVPPSDVVGKKPRWNSGGFWEGKDGRKCTWDDRSHGTGVDRGKGQQGGHWDDENSDNRWDEDGNLLPGSPDLQTAQRNLEWGLIAAGGSLIAATIVEDFLTGGVGILDDPETIGAGIALIGSGLGH
jgi:RHS repeat-associated protein